jgi:hypothetical protein
MKTQPVDVPWRLVVTVMVSEPVATTLTLSVADEELSATPLVQSSNVSVKSRVEPLSATNAWVALVVPAPLDPPPLLVEAPLPDPPPLPLEPAPLVEPVSVEPLLLVVAPPPLEPPLLLVVPPPLDPFVTTGPESSPAPPPSPAEE